jgi:hypothetical protein
MASTVATTSAEIKDKLKRKPLVYVSQSLLECNADLIVQNNNCLTCTSQGLAKAIDTKFDYGNLYAQRIRLRSNLATTETRGTPGTLTIMLPTKTTTALSWQPQIACLLAQWRPGKANNTYYRGIDFKDKEGVIVPDSAENRIHWFATCLERLLVYLTQNPLAVSVRHVAFPTHIGCGLAGGNWPDYLERIQHFADRCPLPVWIAAAPSK